MITHDVDEAVLLSDRIVMLTNGPFRHHRRNPRASSCRVRATASNWCPTATTSAAREAVLKFLYERNKFVEAA